ncbi:MAG: thioesterase domain-containing protein [Bacteroidota bacterium]
MISSKPEMNKTLVSKFFILCLSTLCLFSCFNKREEDIVKAQKLQAIIEKDIKVERIIVLCHGLGRNPEDFEAIQAKLQEAFPEACVIKPHEKETAKKSIEEQKKAIVEDLIKRTHKDIEKKDPIMLIGHSQGGLRAYWTALQLTAKGYTVAGVITIGTPWKGASVINTKSTLIKKAKDFKLPKRFVSWLGRIGGQGQGLEDMRPESPFLNQLHQKLKKNKIAVMALGGNARSLSRIPGATKFLGWFIGGTPHDLAVPLNSQLAQGIETKCFERHVIEATHKHYAPLSKKKIQLEHPEMINEMIGFIGRKWGIIPAKAQNG